jgi:hypothetical protein
MVLWLMGRRVEPELSVLGEMMLHEVMMLLELDGFKLGMD